MREVVNGLMYVLSTPLSLSVAGAVQHLKERSSHRLLNRRRRSFRPLSPRRR
jgi:hypothetical protein